MSTLNLEVSASQVILPRCVQVLGAGMMFVPINTIAYRFIPRSQTNNASGLFSLVRNEGSSIGVALVTTLLQRHTQVHQSQLAAHINPLNPLASEALQRISGMFSGDSAAMTASLRVLYSMVQRQAAALSYLDMFRLFAIATLLVIPPVLFMRKGAVTQEALGALGSV